MTDKLWIEQEEDRWPYWPMLPMKRPKAGFPMDREFGKIFAENKATVCLNHGGRLEYQDVDAMLADGWVVD